MSDSLYLWIQQELLVIVMISILIFLTIFFALGGFF
jgi:hypothetical protein